MSRRQRLYLIICGMVLFAAAANAQSAARPGYDIEFIGPPLADPIMQHNKEQYVLYGCAYCHGLNLESRSEATDLLNSRLVGRDENANLIGPILRKGIPQTAKLSPMPQFSDLSEQQIGAISAYIHYARQQERYKEFTQAKDPAPGNSAAGKAYFDQNCITCHASVNGLAKNQDSAALRLQILRPKFTEAPKSFKVDALHDTKTAEARHRHLWLLENYSPDDVANLTTYLQSEK
jgi:mono/diheme cytochrome c family protein